MWILSRVILKSSLAFYPHIGSRTFILWHQKKYSWINRPFLNKLMEARISLIAMLFLNFWRTKLIIVPLDCCAGLKSFYCMVAAVQLNASE